MKSSFHTASSNVSLFIHWIVLLIGSAYFFLALTNSAAAQDSQIGDVDFSRDIRPILSDTCFKCHGPDEEERAAGLRLDDQDVVFDEFEAVVPGDLDGSELYQRITSDDPDTLMPPAKSGRKLSAEQKDLIKRWIEQGAQWEQHWSFNPLQPMNVPEIKEKSWAINPIDHFIAQRIEQEGLKHAPLADRPTLIRRVSLDLTGLPASSETTRKYEQSLDESWYEQLVDELLASDAYGEHMARFWLDAARYGDTHGLHLDNYREMWPYRDWVINAFNQNISFKDFTIQQLAGDMLENATDAQKIASGFNRAHITTNEGGAIVEEVYVRNVVDRVSTTGTVFMGLTVGCAQCHDHKFDPISQKEFYQLFAFFNNMTDPAMDKNAKDPAPVLRVGTSEQKEKLGSLESQLNDLQSELKKKIETYEYVDTKTEPAADEKLSESTSEEGAVAAENTNFKSEDESLKQFVWLDDKLPAGAKPEETWKFVTKEEGPVNTGETSREQTGTGMVQHFFTKARPIRVQTGDRFFANVYLDVENPPTEIMLQFNDGDWSQRVYWGKNEIDWGKNGEVSRVNGGELPESGKWIQLEFPVEKLGFKNESLINGIAFTQFGGTAHWDSAGVYSSRDQATEFTSLSAWEAFMRKVKGEGLPDEIKKIIKKPSEDLKKGQQKKLRDYFLTNVHPTASQQFTELKTKQDIALKQVDELKNSMPTTLVSDEAEKIKPAYLLNRGEYDQKGDEVQRETPAALPPFPKDAPKNRLGLAQWLIDPANPLTSRVTVNRFWQQVFGIGIVKTSDDFGAQGDVPSHPQLLDWLALDFMQHDWDVKHLMKTIVMSSTYRQSSTVSPELVKKDPTNRLLARGPRFRLDAETLRDQVLQVSGLLVSKIGGPSVKPPQPDGLWFVVGYSGSNTVRFKKDEGPEKVHRRSLYTFLKRTAPPPQMNTFDAPSRESCSVRRERTNTPLQALLLMNDPQYVEAARFLAQKTVDAVDTIDVQQRDEQRMQYIFETAMGRPASESEAKVLLESLKADTQEFSEKPGAAKELLSIGEKPADEKYEANELAAWTMVASLIMNMDEFVTKN